MTSTSIHLLDAARPDDDSVQNVSVYSDVIPRVGDRITFSPDRYRRKPDEPLSVSGVVARVEIEYRRLTSGTTALVSVYLDDYKLEP